MGFLYRTQLRACQKREFHFVTSQARDDSVMFFFFSAQALVQKVRSIAKSKASNRLVVGGCQWFNGGQMYFCRL